MATIVTIVVSLLTGWFAHELNVRAQYKQSQLEWLRKTYIEFVGDLRVFFSGNSSSDSQKIEKANEIIGKYLEATLYASPEVVKNLQVFIREFQTSTSSDEKTVLAKEVILSMRKQLQGKRGVESNDIEFFSIVE